MPPSTWNWTVPVGVLGLGNCGLMVAVKVTGWPDNEGLSEESSVVVVAVRARPLTVCPPDRVPELLAKLLLPP